jgi:hypothetical protein
MKRIWIYSLAGLLAPLALMFATPALADSQSSRSNSQPNQGQMMAPSPGSMAASGMTPAETGVVQGTVRAINFRAGILEINSAGRTVALHAKPDQLADFQPGDLVSVNYDDFAGVLWLASNLNEGTPIGNQNFAISGTVTGTVSALNKARGYLTLMGPNRNQTFLAHPLDIKNLVPGQFVSLSFERIGGRDWVSSIQEAPSNAPVNQENQR